MPKPSVIFAASEPPSDDREKLLERNQVVKEICEGEALFLADLRLVVRLFMEPLSRLLSKQDIAAVFGNLTEIIKVCLLLLVCCCHSG